MIHAATFRLNINMFRASGNGLILPFYFFIVDINEIFSGTILASPLPITIISPDPSMTENSSKLTLEQAFQHGVSLYQRNLKADARAVFEEILAMAPDAIPVLQVLAVLDSEAGLYPKAEKRLRRAADLAPEDPSVLYDLAVVLKEQGKNLEAMEWVELLLSHNPSNQELLAMRQTLTAKIGNRAESRRTAKAAETLADKNAAVENEILATLEAVRQLVQTGNIDQAETLLKAILAIAPTHAAALVEKGKLLTTKDNLPEARQSFLLALNTADDKIEVTRHLVDCEVSLSLLPEAGRIASMPLNNALMMNRCCADF